MKIALGADHGGFAAKEELKKHLEEKGIEVIDCGTFSSDSCDYPYFALEAASKVASKEADKGVLICNSGEGVCMCANKVKGIRCGIGYNDEVAHLIVEHNHADMIAFGALFTSTADIIKRVDIFLSSSPLGDNHQRRVSLIEKFEEKGSLKKD